MTNKFKIWLQEVRAPFFTASIIPVLLGTIIAFNEINRLNWFYFLLTLIGGVLLHAGANVSNDYFDHLSQDDEVNEDFVRPFTGGSRIIQNGLLTPKEVLIGALIFYFIAAVIGIYLTFKVGNLILILGVIGIISGFFYTAPPFYFVSRGIGEIIIGLNFGVLMTLGAFYVQTGMFKWEPIVASLPIACLIAAVLYINEFQDYKADKSVGKNHMVVRLGKQKAVYGYVLILFLTYMSLVVGVVTDILPPLSLIGLLSLPLAFKAINITLNHYDDNTRLTPANAATITNHLLTGLLLFIGYFINVFI